MEQREDIGGGNEIRLTQFSRGAGCGCKISPEVLEKIIHNPQSHFTDPRLIVGNDSNDDAAVFDMGDGSALISTTDFFMPIVDDAFDFGRIASANAISDVYAMGGHPLLAVAILGWPVEKLSPELAAKVLEGARAICSEAGIALAGGHSVDSAEPFFGLAVTGKVELAHLKRNNTAKEGDHLYMTKAIGTGILSTAQKRGLLDDKYYDAFLAQLIKLNSIGEKLGEIDEVTSMTDITGFGLLGHLVEMADGAGLSAEVYYNSLPVMDGAKEYLKQRVVPDATYRNWNSYSKKVSFEKGLDVMEAFNLLPDPQTNGGLLFSVSEGGRQKVEALLKENNISYTLPVGRMISRSDKTIHCLLTK